MLLSCDRFRVVFRVVNVQLLWLFIQRQSGDPTQMPHSGATLVSGPGIEWVMERRPAGNGDDLSLSRLSQRVSFTGLVATTPLAP